MALTPGDRVKIISGVADRLGQLEYPIVDLTLSQFGLATSDSWNGTKIEYVIAMIKGANDSVLQALGAHVGIAPEVAAAAQAIEAGFWHEGFFRVFISHLSAHKVDAANLQDALRAHGVTAFVAHNDIEPTRKWQDQIELALATCDALIALLHPDFHQSSWTDQEIGFAMGRPVPVYAVRLGADPYGFIGKFQAFNGGGKTAWALATELASAYRRNKETAPAIADATVSAFEQSGSFNIARDRMAYLEELPIWNAAMVERVALASESNYEIKNAWGVPDRVQALLKKWTTA